MQDQTSVPDPGTTNGLLDHALALAARGFSVIPLRPRDKKPAAKWERYQTERATEDQVRRWFGNGAGCNLGIVTGRISNLVAVDPDTPEAVAWVRAHLPATRMKTRTAHGEHWFYRHPGVPIRNKARIQTDDPAVAIDLRADGGYVVAPGSVHPSGAVYERVGDWPPVDCLPVFDPAWLARPGEPTPTTTRARPETDNVRRARAYLDSVPGAVQGEAGDHHTFVVACRLVRDFGLDRGAALQLLHEWNTKCEPPWNDRDLELKIDGALKYGTGAIGSMDRPTPKVKAGVRHQHDHPHHEVGVRLEDFHAYMPTHAYIFGPTAELWPGSSVNARVAPVPICDDHGRPVQDPTTKAPRTVKATTWLDQHAAIEQMTWCPGHPKLLRDRLVSEGGWIERPGCTTFNLYRPPLESHGDASKAAPWLEHVYRVYPQDAEHLIAWLAHRVQRPAEKINHAIVLGGLQGIGKDTLLEPVKDAVGPWNFVEVSPGHLLGRFNGFAKSVILRISEARDLGDVDRYTLYDHLKVYEAAPPDVLRVDEKHLREYSIFNVCGVIITTNHKIGGLYLPADDRRHYVAWSDVSKDDFEPGYWTRLYRWFDEGGRAHVAAFLREYDLSGFNPKAPPPKTAAFWDLVDADRAPEDAELADALDRLGNPLVVTLEDLTSPYSTAFSEWLKDRKNGRQVSHRMQAAGYVPVRNDCAKDGLWKCNGRRQVIYGRHDLALRDRLAAARERGGSQ